MKDIHTEVSEQKVHCSGEIKYTWISKKVDINQIQTMFIVQSVTADADLGKTFHLGFHPNSKPRLKIFPIFLNVDAFKAAAVFFQILQ